MTLLLGVQATTNCPRILMARKLLLCWILRLNCSEKNAANKPRSSRFKKCPPPESSQDSGSEVVSGSGGERLFSADSDCGDELPGAWRSGEPRELLGAAGERWRRSGPAAAPLEPGAAAAIGSGDGRAGAGRRFYRRDRGLRRGVLRHRAARGAGDGP